MKYKGFNLHVVQCDETADVLEAMRLLRASVDGFLREERISKRGYDTPLFWSSQDEKTFVKSWARTYAGKLHVYAEIHGAKELSEFRETLRKTRTILADLGKENKDED